MRKTATLILALLTAIPGSGAAYGQAGTRTREYGVPNHGKLILVVPPSLKETSEPLAEPASLQLRFRPQTGDAFYVQVTTVWLDAATLATLTPESMKAAAAKSAEGLLQHAVEKEAPLKEIHGSDARGFYYSLTDRAPGPGEYKYLSQGAFVTGELMTVFTILNRDPVCPECEQVLHMFEQAKYAK